MRTSVSAKRCPQCGKVTGLHMSECGACGHQFRTRFEEQVERTEAFDAVMLPRPPTTGAYPTGAYPTGARPLGAHPPRVCRPRVSPFVLAFLGSFCLVAVVGLGAWLALNVNQSLTQRPDTETRPYLAGPSSAGRPVPTYTATRPAGRAEDLYERIEISMSLYDVDQAAGGMGRLARSFDPHVLLLSYDYADQSVRVSLFRSDLSGTDYRVQAVALYRGNTLLHRHTDDS